MCNDRIASAVRLNNQGTPMPIERIAYNSETMRWYMVVILKLKSPARTTGIVQSGGQN